MTTLKDIYPLYLNNKAAQPNADLEVTDKFTGELAFRVAQADAATISEGIAGAVRAAEPMARMAAYERQAVLDHCVKRFRERFDELAYALCVEAGKPIKDAEGEVGRLIDTFRIAAEEATRLSRSTSRPAPGAIRAYGSGCRSAPARSSRRSTSP
jgi:acyl-CoA reductase-like NAD-dependent aldehyde dehydrogenase